MTSYQKIKPYRDNQYLDFIGSKACGCGCGAPPPSDPHHVRRAVWGAGTAIKPHDYATVPRARGCHQAGEGRDEYYLLHEIIKLQMEYIDSTRRETKNYEFALRMAEGEIDRCKCGYEEPLEKPMIECKRPKRSKKT